MDTSKNLKSFRLILLGLLGFFSICHLKIDDPSYSNIAQAESSNLQPIVKIEYYPVYGSNVQKIRDFLRTKGILYPKDGRRYAGYTQWNVAWRYHYQFQNQGCRLTDLKVQTSVTMTLPRWQVPPHPPQSLLLKWTRFSQALRQHEEGHQRHGILAGQEVWQTLQTTPPSPTCPQLEQKLNETGKNIIKKYNQADLRYDRQTQHGITQGAMF